MKVLTRSEQRLLDELRAEGWTIEAPAPIEVPVYLRETAIGERSVKVGDPVSVVTSTGAHEGRLLFTEGPISARVILDHENFTRWVEWTDVTPIEKKEPTT